VIQLVVRATGSCGETLDAGAGTIVAQQVDEGALEACAHT